MTIEILSIQDTCQHQTRAQRTATADESLIGVGCTCMNAQKITPSGYPLCTIRMLNYHPASICSRKWHDADKRLFRRAFPQLPGTA